jgi:hypothetical protein
LLVEVATAVTNRTSLCLERVARCVVSYKNAVSSENPQSEPLLAADLQYGWKTWRLGNSIG